MSVRTILKNFFWPQTMGSVMLSPSRSAYPYASQVGDGLASSTAMAVVQFMMRAFPEAVLVVYAEQGSERTIQQRHPLARLVQQPNPAYSGMQLWMATVCDWCWFGEAYWRIVYESGGRPGQLWWVPPWSMIPQWPADGSQFISHYTYTPWQGQAEALGLDEVIHFRHSLDPRNPRHGLPPLRSVLREIWSDDEASIWVASLLRNMAVPGLLITPKGDLGVTPDELEAVKAYIAQAFTGDHRGEPLALQAPTDVQKLSFSPHEFDLAVIRDTTEERVSAALGIPSAVIGFGSGLQSTKVGAPQPLSARLWTPTGPTTMGAIQAGDTIAIPNGWGTVQAIYPQGEQEIYRITFQDGSTAESTLDHLWQVKSPKEEWKVLPLATIAAYPAWKLKRTMVPLQGVTAFDEQEVLIPPYVLGLLLADGSFRRNLFFSNTNLQIVETIRDQVGLAYAVNQTTPGGYDYRIAYRAARGGRGIGGGTGNTNPFIDELRRLGLWMLTSSEKFIPDLYKYNSVQVRTQLLQGVLDGDGWVNHHGQPAIEQTSARLAKDITEVVQSLGGYTLQCVKRANLSTRYILGRAMASRYARIHQSIVIDDAASLFACDEKAERCRPRTKATSRKFRTIEFVRREQAQCIKVAGGLYLTNHFITTHNTMHELVQLAWSNGLFPVQRAMAADIDRVLLPQFEPNPRGLIVGWDYRHVRGLQEEESAKAIRLGGLVQAGVLQRAEARRELGLPIETGDRVYHLAMNIQQISPDWPVPPKPPPVPVVQPATGNGASTNGNGTPANGNGNGARAQVRADESLGVKATHEAFVTQVIARRAARLDTTPPRLTQAVTSLMQAAQSLEAETAQTIAEALSRFGTKISTTARAYFNRKHDLQAMVDAGILLEDDSTKELREDLTRLYEALATAVALLVIKSLQEDMPIEPFNIPRILANVRAQMAQRVSVLNLPIELRAYLERILEEGRAEGLLPGELATRLAVELPAGRWRSIESRAEVIAQTELRFAANVTTLTVARVHGVSRVLAMDALLGSSDALCELRHGLIVTTGEAEVLLATEHVRGTLMFMGLSPSMLEQLTVVG